MEFWIVNQAKYLIGAHATTQLINDFVQARLGTYGAAVAEIEITLLYPPKRLTPKPTDHLDEEFRRVLKRSPRATFFRAKRLVEVRAVCRDVSPRSITADHHLTLDEATRVASAASEALELIRPRFRPADRFDVDGFIRDAQDALSRSPAAIRRWLRPNVSGGKRK